MLDTLNRIVTDDSGDELRRFVFRATLCVLCVIAAINIAFMAAAYQIDPATELDGSAIAIVDGAYTLYWWPVWSMVAATFVLGLLLGVPLSAGWHSLLLPALVIAYLVEGSAVLRVTNWHIEREADFIGIDYVSCTKIRYFEQGIDFFGPLLMVWSGRYGSSYDYVYTRNQDQCEELKNQLGGISAIGNNVFSEHAWFDAYDYRKAIDPDQERSAPD